jgi:hypothetical protein
MFRSFAAITWLVLALGLGACGLLVQSPVATPAVCDGVDSGLGGCDPDQPQFTGTSCESVAREFGAQLDDRLVPILEGEDVVDGEHKSVRMAHAVALMVTRVDQYLTSPATALDCRASSFLDVAEEEFSPELEDNAGKHLFGSGPRPYSAWREDLLTTLDAIEREE